jgi:hypothetical protein
VDAAKALALLLDPQADPPVGERIGWTTAVQARLAQLEAIERRAIEWRSDTTLTHPSASELAINNAMSYVLDGDGEDTAEEPTYAYGAHCGGEEYVLCDSREEAERLIARALDLPVRLMRRRVGPWQPVEAGA